MIYYLINELLVFGIPIIFNPTLLIPFLTVPLACYTVAYLALSLGLVPLITNGVAWTTPVLVGGYYATGSLVRGLFDHENVREIIASISRLAASLGMTVLAEFVETLEQREALHQIGCDQYQGYLYSPAIPLE